MILLAEENPDIVVLDWMLPNLSGIEVCRQIKTRPETRNTPVIMLSARSEEVDRVRGLETGADDYVVKPYSVLELMARVRAQLRRARPSSVGMSSWNTRTSRSRSRNPPGDARGVRVEAWPDGIPPADHLHGKAGPRLVTREQLLDRVWGRDIYVDSRTVDVHIGRLRKALSQHGGADPLRTVRGAGYALG